MEYFRATREPRHALVISDPRPVASIDTMWASAGQVAMIGIFLLLLGAFLYVGRAILLPIFAAAVIALTLGPLVKAAKRRGISPWVTSTFLVLLCLGVLGLGATMAAGPVSKWIERAPEIGATVKQRLSVLEGPIESLRELERALVGGGVETPASAPPPATMVLPVVAFVTPAAGELLLFFGTLLFFLAGQLETRAHFVSMFGDHDAKLRFLKIMRDIERNLAGYLTVVTMVNFGLGTIVAAGAWLIGLPNPIIFGLLAALFNYVPYVGPAVMVVILFAVGLVTFPSLGHAAIAPVGLIALTTTEGHFITPAIVGRRLTLNPLLVILALAFWTWLWGPLGAFLAVPVSIIGLVVVNHLFPTDEIRLPD